MFYRNRLFFLRKGPGQPVFLTGLCVLIALCSCQKLPQKKDYLSTNASFNREDIYEPFLGRTALKLTEFNADASTYPLHFTIINARHAKDGTPAPELGQKSKVMEWKRNYTGNERSLEEINEKRIWVEKPFLDIREGSGDFIFWNASEDLIHSYPDTGYLFDVQVENKGNVRVFTDFHLRPLKAVPYEPYEFDLYTRAQKKEDRMSPDGVSYSVPYTIHPTFINNMYYTRDSLFNDTLVSVYFHRNSKSTAHTLTFRFLDEDFNPIDPGQFSPLDWQGLKPVVWDSLVHGFNIKKTASELTYDVAYPIPLTQLNTRYATDGKAHVAFGYSRKGYGGRRVDASFGLEFSIYQPGAWVIIFYFRRNPIFTDA